MIPHVHAEVIKAWADGHVVQYWSAGTNAWEDVGPNPGFYEGGLYRVKPQPHKWQKEMDAFYKDKKDIQCRSVGRTTWTTWIFGPASNAAGRPDLRFDDPSFEFRIIPEVMVYYAYLHPEDAFRTPLNMSTENRKGDNIKLTYEDGKLVKAEVI